MKFETKAIRGQMDRTQYREHSTPLFLTSSRRSQRALGMKRWRTLHKTTYVIAVALLAHVALLGDVGPGAVMIALGFVARIPPVQRWLARLR